MYYIKITFKRLYLFPIILPIVNNESCLMSSIFLARQRPNLICIKFSNDEFIASTKENINRFCTLNHLAYSNRLLRNMGMME